MLKKVGKIVFFFYFLVSYIIRRSRFDCSKWIRESYLVEGHWYAQPSLFSKKHIFSIQTYGDNGFI